jgi:opacity protein-like surface antigen
MHKVVKYLAIAALTGVIGNTFAIGTGFYLGLMTGPASNTGQEQQAKTESGTPPMTTVKPRTNQWGTRIYLGNKFNPYAGFELGGTYYTTIDYNNQGVETCGGTEARVKDVDIVGKLDYSFMDTVEVFGKGGLAVTYTTTAGGLNSSATECGRSKRQLGYRPTFTIGAGYDFNQNWVVDVSWTRTMVGNIVKNVDFYALGLSYHFVDKYCGQFLCDD